MARPTKNSCDYFPHDTGMRNHKKIKAIRQKFGITGYAIWVMLLELLTGSDGNVIEDTELELELISGDFGVSVTEIRDVLNYCYILELLFLKNGFISSESLDERLLPVYIKRKTIKQLSSKQQRLYGKFHKNTDTSGVSVTETTETTVITVETKPQSKVNKSKVKETIGKSNSDSLSELKTYNHNDFLMFYSVPYHSRTPEFKSMYSEILYERYQKLGNLIINEYPNIRCNFMITIPEFKKIAALHSDQEISEGIKKLSSSGNIKPDSLLHLRITEYIGYFIRDLDKNKQKTAVNTTLLQQNTTEAISSTIPEFKPLDKG